MSESINNSNGEGRGARCSAAVPGCGFAHRPGACCFPKFRLAAGRRPNSQAWTPALRALTPCLLITKRTHLRRSADSLSARTNGEADAHNTQAEMSEIALAHHHWISGRKVASRGHADKAVRAPMTRKLRNEAMRSARQFKVPGSRFKVPNPCLIRVQSVAKRITKQSQNVKPDDQNPPLPSTPVLGTVRATFLETLNWS